MNQLTKSNKITAFLNKLARFVKRGFRRSPRFYLTKVSGVIHVGANAGQERDLYAAHHLNVIWVEPIPEVFKCLEENLKDFPRQKALQYLITDKDGCEYQFHIANNEGLSSSILDLNLHKQIWTDIEYEKSIRLKSVKLATLIKAENIEIDQYDALVMDTQGTEILVLRGAENLLKKFRYIKTEAADFEVYKNCCQVKDIESFLARHGFKELSREKFASKNGVGNCYDIIYKKSKLQQLKALFS